MRNRLGGLLDLLNAAARLKPDAYEKIGAELGFAAKTLHLIAPAAPK